MSSLAAVILSGTVLGLLLFILFINEMRLCVPGSDIRFFAGDTRILRHIYSLADAEILQYDLNCVVKLVKCNNMALHEDKFELLVHKHLPSSPKHTKSQMATCYTLLRWSKI